MTRLRVAFYLGIFAGAATAIVALLDWARIGGGHLGLPFHPGLAAVMGLYMCFRVVLAQRMFGPQKPIGGKRGSEV